MRILLTGHKGFIGSHVYEHLTRIGYDVDGLDRPDDIGDFTGVQDDYDIVIHLAAYAAERSTFDGSFPENAPPPCRPIPPYVSTIIFLPVNPASAYGPPGSANRPVPFTTSL